MGSASGLGKCTETNHGTLPQAVSTSSTRSPPGFSSLGSAMLSCSPARNLPPTRRNRGRTRSWISTPRSFRVHIHPKRGAGFGYSGVRGLNVLLATLTTTGNATVIIGHRLRRDVCVSPLGVKRTVADALAMTSRLSQIVSHWQPMTFGRVQ